MFLGSLGGALSADVIPTALAWGTLLLAPGGDLRRNWLSTQRVHGASPLRSGLRAAAVRIVPGVLTAFLALAAGLIDADGMAIGATSAMVWGALGALLVCVAPRPGAVLPLLGVAAIVMPIATGGRWLDPDLLRNAGLLRTILSSTALAAALVLAAELVIASRATRP